LTVSRKGRGPSDECVLQREGNQEVSTKSLAEGRRRVNESVLARTVLLTAYKKNDGVFRKICQEMWERDRLVEVAITMGDGVLP